MRYAAPGLDRRRAGVCLHLTSLPGRRGIGELGAEATRFMDWMQAHGLSVWQFLPVGPTGFGNSPYQPLSVFAGNPRLLDLDVLADWELLTRDEVSAAGTGTQGQVDFDRIARVKAEPLALAADRLNDARQTGFRSEYEDFVAANAGSWLDAWTTFAVLKRHHGNRAWPEWPESDRHFEAAVIDRCAHEHARDWGRERAIQFLFARQWRALRDAAAARGIVLFGDVPIYMALDCAESWARPDLLMLDAGCKPLELAGVPPDYFSADGQLWGNPLYRWEAHAADGFRWWLARIRHALATADLLRLDHFRGFDEYWSVPAGAATAREGRWLPGPRGALFDALAAELGPIPCVAEDLGMITESVVELRRAYALPGMQVLQFLLDQPDFEAGRIEEDCICYTGTHDNDTVAGWFSGSAGRLTGEALESMRAVVRQNLNDFSQDIHKSMINYCFQSRSMMAIAPVQDYLGLGSEARLNTPGEASGNWRWQLPAGVLDAGDCGWIGDLVAGSARR